MNQHSFEAEDTLVINQESNGFIYIEAIDGAGNKASAWSNGYVIDRQRPGGTDGDGIDIVAPMPNKYGFYNTNIPISVFVTEVNGDFASGIRNVSYSVMSNGTNTASAVLFDNQTGELTKNQMNQYMSYSSNDILVKAANNESNEVIVQVKTSDKAGNENISEAVYKIDITKPIVKMHFSNEKPLNDIYYGKSRTATITVDEKNFAPELISLLVYKDGVLSQVITPDAGAWQRHEDIYITTYTFAEDGRYSLQVVCEDMAGNNADVISTSEFVIDRKAADIKVEYDNNNSWTKNYYNELRTATITVFEENFKEEDFCLTINSEVEVSDWTHIGNEHTVTVMYLEDGFYTGSIDYVDMAGNRSETYVMESFYIDTQKPELDVSGVKNNSANAGDVIPVIYAGDANFDLNGIRFSLIDSTGMEIPLDIVVEPYEAGYVYTLSNVNSQPDQIYTFSVILTDMAGNVSEESYKFSLNRGGSTYDLGDIEAVVDKTYVTSTEISDLHITEYNVDEVEEFNIYIVRGGEVVSEVQQGRPEGEVEADVTYYEVQKSGDADTGYEYKYTIFKENFTEEGIYNILFYSKDIAGNEVNNTLTDKGAEITFIIDNTPPTVVVSGIEPGGFYAEEYKDVNVYVSDAVWLEEAYFYLVDEDGNIVMTYNYMELVENAGDIATIRIPNNDKGLYLDYYAKDKAGNEAVYSALSETVVPASFMVSTDAWLQIRNNKNILIAIVAGSIIVIGLISTMIVYIKKRRTGRA